MIYSSIPDANFKKWLQFVASARLQKIVVGVTPVSQEKKDVSQLVTGTWLL